MNKLDFSYNWNNKLRCRTFTTIRLKNGKKYYPGACFEVCLQGYPKGKAKVVDVKTMKLKDISNWIAYLDTGYTALETMDIIKKMYKNKPYINWDTQELSYVLLAFENQEAIRLFKD
jgi:hypothetical protein